MAIKDLWPWQEVAEPVREPTEAELKLAEIRQRLGAPRLNPPIMVGVWEIVLALLDRIEQLEQEAATRKGAVSDYEQSNREAQAEPRQPSERLEGTDGKPLC